MSSPRQSRSASSSRLDSAGINRPTSSTKPSLSPRSGQRSRSMSPAKSAESRSKSPPKSAGSRSKSPSKSAGSRSKSPSKSAGSRSSKSPIKSAGSRPSSRRTPLDSRGGQDRGDSSRKVKVYRVKLPSADIESQGLRCVDMGGQGMTSLTASLFTSKLR